MTRGLPGRLRRTSRRSMAALLLVATFAEGCATGGGAGGAAGSAPSWPFHGFTRYDGLSLNLFRDHLFSPGTMAVDPTGTRLFVPAGRSGAMTIVRLPEVSIDAVYDFGEGSSFEQIVFRPDGQILYAFASTVEAANLGRVPLARALLEVELGAELGQQPVSLRPGAWSRGVALWPDRGLLYSLDTAGPDLGGGATLTRIDLYSQEVALRRRLGSVPDRVRDDALVYDDRERWILALLSDDEPSSDFDPPDSRTEPGGSFVAWIDPDSLGIRGDVRLDTRLEYLGIIPSSRGIIAVGIDPRDRARGTALIEIDPRMGRDVAWLDLPEPVNDMARAGSRVVFPTPRGLYVVSLDFLSIEGFIAVPFDRPVGVALTPDGGHACVTFDDPDAPGRTALAVVDVDAGRLVRVIR
ncbi:MAG TPA: hypothetical protein VF720_05205 [Candidatus Eisenbacteria bacterium]